MIEVQALTKYFGDTLAVDQLSFTLAEGQTLVLAGTSGSGKTTTLKMINRLVEPSSGRILLNGEDILQQPKAQMRRRMGYVIQHIGLFPHYTIAQNIGVVPALLGWPKERVHRRAAALLERLGLPPDQFLSRYPHELSGGQQQRVGIARALAADPPVILMDEPFGAVDPITRAQLRRDFRELEELSGKTTILVTHDVEEAFELGNLICLLDHGQVQQFGTPQELLFQPANDFVRQFIGSQQLQLAYQTLTLRDVLAVLPELPLPAGTSPLSFSPEARLIEVQQRLLDQSTTPAWGQIGEHLFRTTDLLAACENRLKQHA